MRSLDTVGVVAGDRVAVENWSFGHGRRLRRVFRVEPTGSVTLIDEGAFDY